MREVGIFLGRECKRVSAAVMRARICLGAGSSCRHDDFSLALRKFCLECVVSNGCTFGQLTV